MPFKAFTHARQLWLAHRINRVRRYMQRERALHQQHMAQLRAELDLLQLRQARLHASAPPGGQGVAP